MIKRAISSKTLSKMYEDLAKELPRNASVKDVLTEMSKKIKKNHTKDAAITAAVLGALGAGTLGAVGGNSASIQYLWRYMNPGGVEDKTINPPVKNTSDNAKIEFADKSRPNI